MATWDDSDPGNATHFRGISQLPPWYSIILMVPASFREYSVSCSCRKSGESRLFIQLLAAEVAVGEMQSSLVKLRFHSWFDGVRWWRLFWRLLLNFPYHALVEKKKKRRKSWLFNVQLFHQKRSNPKLKCSTLKSLSLIYFDFFLWLDNFVYSLFLSSSWHDALVENVGKYLKLPMKWAAGKMLKRSPHMAL